MAATTGGSRSDPAFPWLEASVAQLQEAMGAGRLSAAALVAAYLRSIEAIDRRGPQLRSVIELNPDAPAIAAALDAEQVFVRSLSAMSRVLRFHAGIHELAPDLLRAMTQVDPQRHVALVVQHGGPDGPIVADARYVVDDHEQVSELSLASSSGNVLISTA